MRILTIRRAAVAAVLPLTLGSLAACGSGNDPTTAADPAGSSSPTSSPTADASTSDGSTGTQGQAVDAAQFLAMMQDAGKKITTAGFSMNMEVSGQTIPVKGVIDMTGDSPAMQMTMDITGAGTPSDLRLIDKVMYIQVPGTDGKFYKMDLNDPNGPLASLSGTFDNLDPGSMMSAMSAKMFRKVTDRGVSTVKGQQLHHYTAVLDLAASTKLPNMPNVPRSALPKTAAYDVWFDDQGRLARFSMLIAKTMKMTATYSNYGSPVHITAPPAADVVELPGSSATG